MECQYCRCEMTEDSTVTCEANAVVEYPNGMKLHSLHHDEEQRCGDCNVAQGGFHHPGCDMERCPNCHGQLIGCGCMDEEDDDGP